MKVKSIGPFQVMEKDRNTYKLKDIGMAKNPLVLSSIVWVYCKDELVTGKVYKGKLSFDPDGLPIASSLPVFILNKNN